MAEAAVARAAAKNGLRVQAANVGSAAQANPSLVVSKDDKPLMRIGFEEGHHAFIHVTDPRFATAEGAHVGMGVRRLGRLYGRGFIYQGPYSGGRTVVEFEGSKAFGLDFTLDNSKRPTFRHKGTDDIDRSRADWQHLMRANPRVTAIDISGE